VFVMGTAIIAVSIVLMVAMRVLRPAFFRRRPETWPGEGQPIPYQEERVE
jgi:hypothetical protein